MKTAKQWIEKGVLYQISDCRNHYCAYATFNVYYKIIDYTYRIKKNLTYFMVNADGSTTIGIDNMSLNNEVKKSQSELDNIVNRLIQVVSEIMNGA